AKALDSLWHPRTSFLRSKNLKIHLPGSQFCERSAQQHTHPRLGIWNRFHSQVGQVEHGNSVCDSSWVRVAGIQIRENYDRKAVVHISRDVCGESLPSAT